MLALLLSQAMLGTERGRSMASLTQSGSTAPALHTRKAQILNMSRCFMRSRDATLDGFLNCDNRLLNLDVGISCRNGSTGC
jgi:hypothetical protein